MPELASIRDEARHKYPSDVVDFLYLTTLADLFKLELDCYLWYQPREKDNDNLGWLQVCWYSLAQDVVRQDLYYLLYIVLREDNAYKLISYSYYCKYSHENDETGFRHIDLNIPKLLSEQRGKYQIQGSMSLDDEKETDCTIVVKGFHRDEVIRTWYNRWQDKISNSYHNISADKCSHPRSFCNYYRDFLRDYSRVTRPLNLLTKKEGFHPLSPNETEAFERTKALILEGRLLAHYSPFRET